MIGHRMPSKEKERYTTRVAEMPRASLCIIGRCVTTPMRNLFYLYGKSFFHGKEDRPNMHCRASPTTSAVVPTILTLPLAAALPSLSQF